jgi:hypothetical protein
MVKSAASLAAVALLSASVTAFAPSKAAFSRIAVALNAEKSKSLPFMNRPALVSDCFIFSVVLVLTKPYLWLSVVYYPHFQTVWGCFRC